MPVRLSALQFIVRCSTFVLVFCLSASCADSAGKVTQPSSSTSPLSSQDARDYISSNLESWLPRNDNRKQAADLSGALLRGGRGEEDLPCEGQSPDTRVISTNGDMTACLRSSGTQFYMRIKNLTDVPISVYGEPFGSVFTIQPSHYFDIPILSPRWGQYLNYNADINAAVGALLINQVTSQIEGYAPAGYQWNKCARTPESGCILDTLTESLPETVKVGKYKFPLKTFMEGVSLVFQNRDFATALIQRARNVPPGTLTMVHGG